MKAIILAGGFGTRLWPMSRATRPKQFFDVVGSESLIRDTYRRLLKSFAAEDIYFSVTPSFKDLLLEHFPDIPAERIFVEPEKRDTGPAMGYVAAKMELICPNESIVFVPSDHYIGDEEKFLACLAAGDRLIQETGKMVDIAIVPAFPSITLGYTKIGQLYESKNGIEVYQFAGHAEKPPYEIAKSYLESGDYLWHANYYMWTPRKFMEAIAKYAPEMGVILREIQNGHDELYGSIQKISFDYAVTEKMVPADVLVIKGDFGWSDIGAWDTVKDRLADGEVNNVIKGNVISVDTSSSLIYGPSEKLIAVVGLENFIVVDTQDALLICRSDDAARVKEIVKIIEEQGQKDFL
jgi:mannose-1-phosphate guanylyltransferase